MGLSYKTIRNDRQWKATTGISELKFQELCRLFAQAYEGIFGKTLVERQADSTQEALFQSYEDVLFFVLFSLKSGLTYDALGAVFECDGSSAKNNQTFALRILKAALQQSGVMPKRIFESVADLERVFQGEDTLVIDGTEQRVERPENQQRQKEHFSGKKKPYRKGHSH